MWDDDFTGDYYYKNGKRIDRGDSKAAIIGLIACSAVFVGIGYGKIYVADKIEQLTKQAEQCDYTFIVNENDVTVISASKIEYDDNNQCIIRLSNGTQFEVPNDRQAYFAKAVSNEEDVEKYIYSIVGENAKISYLNEEKEDVKKKVRMK